MILADTREEAAAFHATRAMNVVRSQVAPERQRDLHLAVGTPGDFRRGRATLTGDAEHDALARRSLAGLPDRESAVIVIRAFNRPGYAEARSEGALIVDGVVSIGEVPLPRTGLARQPVGLAPTLRLASILAALLGLALVGGGWARRLAGPGISGVALSPAGGMIALALAGALVAAFQVPTGVAPVLALGIGAPGWLLPARRRIQIAQRSTGRQSGP